MFRQCRRRRNATTNSAKKKARILWRCDGRKKTLEKDGQDSR